MLLSLQLVCKAIRKAILQAIALLRHSKQSDTRNSTRFKPIRARILGHCIFQAIGVVVVVAVVAVVVATVVTAVVVAVVISQ